MEGWVIFVLQISKSSSLRPPGAVRDCGPRAVISPIVMSCCSLARGGGLGSGIRDRLREGGSPDSPSHRILVLPINMQDGRDVLPVPRRWRPRPAYAPKAEDTMIPAPS